MNKMGDKFREFLRGRYGSDELSKIMSILGLLFLVLSRIPKCGFFFIIAAVLIILALYRCFSKNMDKRSYEREKFLIFASKLSKKINEAKDSEHSYFKCPSCGATLRVPKGKGEIEITCPKCTNKIKKRT